MEFWWLKSFTEFQFLIDLMDQQGSAKIQEKFSKEKKWLDIWAINLELANLEVIRPDIDNNLIYLRGSIPGSKNSIVYLRVCKKCFKKDHTRKHAVKLSSSSKKGKK